MECRLWRRVEVRVACGFSQRFKAIPPQFVQSYFTPKRAGLEVFLRQPANVSAPIPTEVADITSTWLEGVLQAYAPGARLHSVDVVEAHSGTTGRARVLLAHDDPNLPGSVFVKLAPFDAEQRAFVDQQGMGIAEARFYAEIATDVPVRHPQPFYAAHDDAGRCAMVLEDLHAVGARYPGT